MTKLGRRMAAAALVANLRLRLGGRDRQVSPPSKPSAGRPVTAFDFTQLAAHRELKLMRTAGVLLGVGSPYYRVFEGPAAPVVESEGAPRLNFATYDYLGFNRHPAVVRAVHEAIDRYGVSCSASRVVGGERPFHAALEAALAACYGVEAAVVMVSGHATNVTTIGCLVGPSDLVIHDELIHNSAMEGIRLSGAKRLMMPHNDLDWLEDTLRRLRAEHERVLIVVEGLYSMDGDVPDLGRLVEIKAAFDAWLMVDEAHALGVLGATGRGLAQEQGVDPTSVEIWMGTLSKTLAATGGYIAGSRALIDVLKAKAPGFVFSVGLPAPLAAAALASLTLLDEEPGRVVRLRANGLRLRDALRAQGLDTGLSEGWAVTPVVLGDSPTTAVVADLLFQKGASAPPIMHPAVPERRARLRLFASSDHDCEQIDRAAVLIKEAVAEAPEVLRRLPEVIRRLSGGAADG